MVPTTSSLCVPNVVVRLRLRTTTTTDTYISYTPIGDFLMKDTFFLMMKIPTVTAQEKQINKKTGTLYNPSKVEDVKEKYLAYLDKFKPDRLFSPPISLRICFMFHSDKVDHPTLKITRPDTDNMLKLLKDCMTKKSFWKDDSHVAMEMTSKYWVPGPEGILIEVEEVEE